MAGDRVASLTVRAARLGLIDFSKARIRDVGWWRRVNILLTNLEQDDDERFLDAAFRFHLAFLSNSMMTEESFNKSRKHALTCFNDLNALRRPWLAKFSAKMKQEEYKGMRAEYEKLLGDPTPGSEFYNNIIMPEIRRMEQEMAQQTEQVESPQQRIDSQYRQRIMADSRKRP